MPNFGYTKSCRGKQKHKSIGLANAHIRALEKIGKERQNLHTYHCPFCRQYHVGRKHDARNENKEAH